MDVDHIPAAAAEVDSLPDLRRRSFVKTSGKALYLAPVLTLLGSAPASAQFGSPPPPPNNAAPAAPAPTE